MGGPLIEPTHCWICSDIQHFQPSVVLNQEHHSLVHALPRLGYVHHLIPQLSSPRIQRMVESNHVRQMKVVGVPHSLQSICKTQVGHIRLRTYYFCRSAAALLDLHRQSQHPPSFRGSVTRGALPDSPSCMKIDHLCADAPQLVRWKNCSCETASRRNASAIRAP